MTDAEPLGDVDLSSALDALRAELEQAWTASRGKQVRFRVSDVALTVQVTARRERQASGKIRWWLIEAGAEGTAARETTQTLVLTLTPGLYDENGQPAPLDVSAPQPVAGN